MRHLSWVAPRALVGNAADRSCRLRLRASLPQGRRAVSASGCARATAGLSCPCPALCAGEGEPSPVRRNYEESVNRRFPLRALRRPETQQMQPKRKSCIINQLQVNPPSPVFTQFCRLFVQVEPFDGFPAQRDCLSGAPTRPWGILHFARRPAFWPNRRLLSAGDDLARDLSCP